MARFYCFLSILIIILQFLSINSNEPGQGLNWYESLPAVAMDYKVHVEAGLLRTVKLISDSFCFGNFNNIFNEKLNILGKEDCYHQYVAAGATFYVSMQVNQSIFMGPSVAFVYFCLRVFFCFCGRNQSESSQIFDKYLNFR